MKTLAAILGLLFVLTISTQSFACDCDKSAKERTSASQTVADAKDVAKDGKACDGTSCSCGESCKCGAGCKCGAKKDGKACSEGASCSCGKDKKAKT